MRSRAAPVALWLVVFAFVLDVTLLMIARLDRGTLGLVHVGAFSVAAFFAYGWDKMRAKRGAMRVRESTLLALTILGGALGALAAMLVFRHKTQKKLFWFVAITSLFAHVTIIGWLFISR
jgi:uncharacterized membrane protein YsdA (DUF1294 family)